MKKIIPFVKDISLGSKISEITSIALEHNLKMENNDSVVGTFTVSGKYKMNEVSINEEVFEQKIDFDITLDDKYDTSNIIIDVDDFYYEIINDEFLRVHIDVKVDNLEYYKQERKPVLEEQEPLEVETLNDNITEEEQEEEKEEKQERNDIMVEESIDTNVTINQEPKKDDDKLDVAEITSNITSGFLGSEEKYSTYKVHIIRESETIQTIMEKYNVSKEELEKYNNLDNVILGTKIVVPVIDE